MGNTQTRSREKLSYDDVKDVIKIIAEAKQSQDYTLVKVSQVQTLLKIEKDLEVSRKTIRDKGISHQGYFEKKYPDACTYKYTGDTNKRGLLINPELMLKKLQK